MDGRSLLALAAGTLVLFGMAAPAGSQELEPRRWGHLPVDSLYTGAAYSYTQADIYLDPVLEIIDGKATVHTVGAKAIYSFDLLGHTARLGLTQPYTAGTWTGVLSGTRQETSRNGLMDPVLRFAVNLVGGPPLQGRDFIQYRAGLDRETTVGAALVLHLPLGQYYEDRLINLGDHRWTIRPQLGVVHTRDRWTAELSASMRYFTDNEDFLGMVREQNPMYALQGHLIYTFPARLWLSSSTGYSLGGATTVGGVSKDDERASWVSAASVGYPVNPRTSVKLAAITTRSQKEVGMDSNSILASIGYAW